MKLIKPVKNVIVLAWTALELQFKLAQNVQWIFHFMEPLVMTFVQMDSGAMQVGLDQFVKIVIQIVYLVVDLGQMIVMSVLLDYLWIQRAILVLLLVRMNFQVTIPLRVKASVPNHVKWPETAKFVLTVAKPVLVLLPAAASPVKTNSSIPKMIFLASQSFAMRLNMPILMRNIHQFVPTATKIAMGAKEGQKINVFPVSKKSFWRIIHAIIVTQINKTSINNHKFVKKNVEKELWSQTSFNVMMATTLMAMDVVVAAKSSKISNVKKIHIPKRACAEISVHLLLSWKLSQEKFLSIKFTSINSWLQSRLYQNRILSLNLWIHRQINQEEEIC